MSEKLANSLVNRIKNARNNIEREARRADLMAADLRDLEPDSERAKNAVAGCERIISALDLLPS